MQIVIVLIVWFLLPTGNNIWYPAGIITFIAEAVMTFKGGIKLQMSVADCCVIFDDLYLAITLSFQKDLMLVSGLPQSMPIDWHWSFFIGIVISIGIDQHWALIGGVL